MSWRPSVLQSTTSCACQSSAGNTVINTVLSNGTNLQRCIVCPSGSRPNSINQCVPVSGSLPDTPLQQLATALRELNIAMTQAQATQAFIVVPTGGGTNELTLTIQGSEPLVNLLGPAALSCKRGLGSDKEACNAVANLCALTAYDPTSAACLMYQRLVDLFVASAPATATSSPPPSPPTPSGRPSTSTGRPSTSTGNRRGNQWRPDTAGMPWLYYGGSNYIDDPNMNLKVKFSGGSISEGKVSMLTFVLSSYLLNGTWLGYTTMTNEFQMCGSRVWDGTKWPRVGWEYDNTCWIKLDAVLAAANPQTSTGGNGTVVHELFLQIGLSTMYPIPVKIKNKDVLDDSTDDTGAVRRFFYVDSRLGYSAQSRELIAVQYPSDVSFDFIIRKDPRDEMYVPQLWITYQGWQTSTLSSLNLDAADLNEIQPASFRANWRNEAALQDKFWYAWQTVLIVFEVVLAFPAMMLSVYRHMRKSRTGQDDLGFLVYGVVCIIDYGSFTLALVLMFVTIYYLTIYKLQEEIYFMMVPDWDLENFRITVILAIVGQSLALCYKIYQQIKVDVFFIDWEKGRKVLSKEGSREEPAPVSCWRMLMVANEWNELQTTRITYPAFTLLLMCFVLDGMGVINAGYMTPDASDYNTYNSLRNSIILRFGIEAFFFLVLYLGQYIWKRLLYYPYVENPVTQFIDLMFLANISTVIFDEPNSGYYLHGRNQAQHSDSTLKDLNQELLKEEEGLTAQRGLITSSNPKLADNQIFLMYVTDSIRRVYDGKMLQLVQQNSNDARSRRGMVSTFVKGYGRQRDNVLNAQAEITTLFKQMVDDVERNHATQVIDPTYVQRFLQLPPENAQENPVFVHDYFNSFTETIFLGIEPRLFVYEALFCCSIDMALKSFSTSAFITFIVSRFFAYVRRGWGEDNLSQKTLVDRHFLI
ncbi:hypothetical protein HYH03_004769 [Edaphochlamys debaryana]|uniref:Meckelin n=1 Tax=Edaphochlamys debaryana TaxID=47281 RepID=A0A835YE86_9CHLO|nr:hypothetical protein HYH03_004769 [Edaphochlamys debaryana]|eukprot:KAG2497180.1 hypothetical protein HYH03_004769 [Edaphochlamys debaryana]